MWGEIKTNNASERVLSETDVSEIVFVRCAYFMENWTLFLDSSKAPERFVFSTITPLGFKVPMVAVRDIGKALAAELTSIDTAGPHSKPMIYELHGPQDYSPLDVKLAITKSLGKSVKMKPVEKHELHGFYSKLFPPEIVPEWVELASSFIPGGILAEEVGDDSRSIVRHGATELSIVIENAVKNL